MEGGSSSLIVTVIVVVIALLFGGFAFYTYRTSRNTGNAAVNEIGELGVQLEEQKFTQYEGATVTGSQVISIITSFQGEAIKVVTPGLTIDDCSEDINDSLDKLRDSSDSAYINPRKRYDISLEYEDGIVSVVNIELHS